MTPRVVPSTARWMWLFLFITVAFVVTGPSAAAARLPAAKFERPPGAGDSERVLTLVAPPIVWREAEGAFYPDLEGFGRLQEVGGPDLPARRERVALVPGGGLEIDRVDVDWRVGVMPGRLAAFPALDPGRPELKTEGRDAGWLRIAIKKRLPSSKKKTHGAGSPVSCD